MVVWYYSISTNTLKWLHDCHILKIFALVSLLYPFSFPFFSSATSCPTSYCPIPSCGHNLLEQPLNTVTLYTTALYFGPRFYCIIFNSSPLYDIQCNLHTSCSQDLYSLSVDCEDSGNLLWHLIYVSSTVLLLKYMSVADTITKSANSIWRNGSSTVKEYYIQKNRE